jgi:hypothetical protein
MKRDLHSNISVVSHIIGTLSATEAPADGVDLQGFNSCEFIINIGAITNIANSPTPSWAFKLQESDAPSSDFTDVTDSNAVLNDSARSPVETPDSSSGVFLTIDGVSEDDEAYRVGYIGTKRYVRVVAIAANAPGNTPLSVLAVLGHPDLAPTSDA